jgi:carbonic anhydrase
MLDRQVSRRSLLVAAGGIACSPAARGNTQEVAKPKKSLPPESPREALDQLIAGNRRFVAGQTQHAHQAAAWRTHLVQGQQPIATILGCSDSRVPPELVFDQGFGDLFVVRVAGNIIEPAVFGSIEYSVVHLQTSLLVVLGHQQCGAVTAALDELRRNMQDQPGIEALLNYVKPSLKNIDPTLPRTKQIEIGVEANVRRATAQIAASPEGKRAIKEGRQHVVGAVYELTTGHVRFLD